MCILHWEREWELTTHSCRPIARLTKSWLRHIIKHNNRITNVQCVLHHNIAYKQLKLWQQMSRINCRWNRFKFKSNKNRTVVRCWRIQSVKTAHSVLSRLYVHFYSPCNIKAHKQTNKADNTARERTIQYMSVDENSSKSWNFSGSITVVARLKIFISRNGRLAWKSSTNIA